MVALQLNKRHPQLKRVSRPIFDERLLMGVVVFDVKVCEEDDRGIGGQEN